VHKRTVKIVEYNRLKQKSIQSGQDESRMGSSSSMRNLNRTDPEEEELSPTNREADFILFILLIRYESILLRLLREFRSNNAVVETTINSFLIELQTRSIQSLAEAGLRIRSLNNPRLDNRSALLFELVEIAKTLVVHISFKRLGRELRLQRKLFLSLTQVQLFIERRLQQIK